MKEVWKDIPGYGGFYQVSNFGRIKSFYSKVSSDKYFKGVLLSPFDNGFGYFNIKLTKGGLRQNRKVHRLVAEAFLGENPNDKPDVNHKNGNKKDNRLDNLEWVSKSENVKHTYDKLGRKPFMKGKVGLSSKISIPVIATNLETQEQIFYGSANLARKDGFHGTPISRCCRGILVSHKGFSWRFANKDEIEEEMQK